MNDDPFVEADDPAAVERERRRLEREARRAKSPSPVRPGPAKEAKPPKPKRAPKTKVAAMAASPRPAGSKPVHSRGRRVGVVLALGAVLLGLAAIAALAYRHFHRGSPPPAVVVRTITLTIPEGYTRAQTAEIAKAEGLRGSYEKATVHSRYLNPAQYGGKGARNLEGFLFPDTFELKKHAGIASLVQLQLEDFKRRVASVSMSYARSKNLSVYDVLTIASMIEHEAGLESQRKLVAAVIYNRLHEGMPLGIDATTRFATGNYTQPLTESELAVDSPYNTRTHAGLPPGPIDSPGLASIEAAAHPANVDYLYYVAEPGACNKLAFSSTEAEFNADVERYNSAREAAGGNSPDSCGE
jgi:UPF0755 protein